MTCSEDESPSFSNPLSTNSDPINFHQDLNLQSIDSGDNLYSVKITWNDLGPVELTDNSSIPPFTFTPNGNSHTFNMTPGAFMDISIQAFTEDSTYTDTIQIFTRTIYPVSNFEFELDIIKVGENVYNSWEPYEDLGNGIWDDDEELIDLVGNGIWDEGEELIDLVGNGVWDEGEEFIDENGDTIYNDGEEFVDGGNGTWDEGDQFIDEINGVWDEGDQFIDEGNDTWDEGEFWEDKDTTKYHRNLKWSPSLESSDDFVNYFIYRSDDPANFHNCNCIIASLSLSDSAYIDSSLEVIDKSDNAAFYYMIQVSIGNFIQNSFIYNYSDFTQLGAITGLNVSTDKNEFIKVTWDPIGNTNYFYQYEILRFLGNPGLGNDTLLIALINNSEINHFIDRGKEFIDGTTYYYSIVVVDINGRSQSSNFIEGFSKP